MEFTTLKSGELAVQVGVSVYAAVPDREGKIRAYSYYNPAFSAVESISLSNRFNRHYGVDTINTVDDFKNEMQTLQIHCEQVEAFGRKALRVSTATPWGEAQGAERYTRGVTSYDTASHGGFKVSKTLNDKIPEILRNEDGWYEEDCEWAKVAFSLPMLFTDLEKFHAVRTLKNYFPLEYEALTGEVLPPGASHAKDRMLFEKEHANDWVVISAVSSNENQGFVECIATVGGQRQKFGSDYIPEEKKFLVPQPEYAERCSAHGFVIDLARHEEIDFLPGYKR